MGEYIETSRTTLLVGKSEVARSGDKETRTLAWRSTGHGRWRGECGYYVEWRTRLTDRTATLDDDVPMTRFGLPLGLGEAAAAADFPPASLMTVPRSRNPPTGNEALLQIILLSIASNDGAHRLDEPQDATELIVLEPTTGKRWLLGAIVVDFKLGALGACQHWSSVTMPLQKPLSHASHSRHATTAMMERSDIFLLKERNGSGVAERNSCGQLIGPFERRGNSGSRGALVADDGFVVKGPVRHGTDDDMAATVSLESLFLQLLGRLESTGRCPVAPGTVLSPSAAKQRRSLRVEIRTLELWRAVIGECLATFFYVFLVCGAHVSWPGYAEPSVLGIALTAGAAAATLCQCYGHISGCHMNPAVTLATFATRKVSPLRALLYVTAQCGGAIAGAALLY
ncbi:hypothetical protein HPB47_005605, partial [Ixodes persulcatus]